MQVKIRPVNGWHPGYEYEWQPIPTFNKKWYQLWSKNIWPDQQGDPEDRRAAALEMHQVMNALYQGLKVQARARYDRQAHRLFIMGANGETLH